MATDLRLLCAAGLAALALALVAGCGRDEAAASESAYRKAVDAQQDERRRLMTEAAEAQKSGDAERAAAAVRALVENRRKIAATVRERNRDLSSKEQTK